MPLPLPRRSKYDRITHEKIAKSIEDDQRDYSDLSKWIWSFFPPCSQLLDPVRLTIFISNLDLGHLT